MDDWRITSVHASGEGGRSYAQRNKAAYLKDQFEFLMSEWMNGSAFAPGIYGTTDPLLGNSPEGENTFVIPREKPTPLVISHFPRLVITRGSVYTFLPSITSLRFIASLP